jgi:MFS family permease
MSYTAPAFIEKSLDNTFLMGLIMAFSSLVGITADFVIGGWLRGYRARFFTSWTIFLAIIFPLTFVLLPASIPVFLLSMAVWGIYYEFMQFSNYHFIQEHTQINEHAFAWGALSMFRAMAYTFGPLIAGLAAVQIAQMPFYISIFLASVAFVIVLIYMFVINKGRPKTKTRDYPHRDFGSEIKVWSLLTGKIWHLFSFVFALSLIDATFWTVGVLFSEDIGHGEQGLILVMYGLPSLLLGMFAGFAAKPFGKKRAAFIAGMIGGIILAMVGFAQNDLLILGLVFASSCFLSLSWPEMSAAFEDYVSRLGKTANEFIGLQSSVISLSYILGPILAGAIASVVGNQATFTVVGIFLTLVSIFSLVVVPRKIHMPQTALATLEHNQNARI